jgi:catechol 2,3-dioxygenase-like lactoylglutathione lyase family enzyme
MTSTTSTAGAESLNPPEWFEGVDHVGWTVSDLDAVVAFYCKAFGAREIFRMGPMAAADLPSGPTGRDWMADHVNVPGATLTLSEIQLTPHLRLEIFQYDAPADARKEPIRNCDVGGHHLALRVSDLDAAVQRLEALGCKSMPGTIMMDDGPHAGNRNRYVVDPWGNQLELAEIRHR